MGDCKCVDAKVTVSNEIEARLDCDCDQLAAVTVGTVAIRDGTNDYERLVHLPRINSVELRGDRSFEELGDVPMTNVEIKEMFDRVFKGDQHA